jgi:hypothetical protein
LQREWKDLQRESKQLRALCGMMGTAIQSDFPRETSISVTDSTPGNALGPDDPALGPDDPDASSASDDGAPAVIRTAIDALEAMLGPARTENRDPEPGTLGDDPESDPR